MIDTTREMISSRLITALNQMGLPHHDAMVYSALVFFKSVGAKDLIGFVRISKPSVYESLERLVDRGLVVKKDSKPAIFTPVSPQVAIDILIRENSRASETALQELEVLARTEINIGENDAIWTVFGEKNVEHKIREMISSAQHHIECMMGEKYLSLFENLKIHAPVSINLISDNSAIIRRAEEILSGTQVSISFLEMKKMEGFGPGQRKERRELKYFDMSNSFELIIDDRETLSIPPIQMSKTTGLHSTNEVLVYIASDRMRSIISHIQRDDEQVSG